MVPEAGCTEAMRHDHRGAGDERTHQGHAEPIDVVKRQDEQGPVGSGKLMGDNGILATGKDRLLAENRPLRPACTTQIATAIQTVGIKQENDFIIFGIGKKSDLQKLYEFLKPFLKNKQFNTKSSIYLKKQFCISKTQLNSTLSKTQLEDLLVEKAAILI